MRANPLGLRDAQTVGKVSRLLSNPCSLHTTIVTQNYYNTLWIHSSLGFKPVIRSIFKVLKTNQELQIYCWVLQVLMSQQREPYKEARMSALLLQPDVHWWRITETNEDRPTCRALQSRIICVGCTELNRGQETIYIYLKCSNPKEMSAFNVTKGGKILVRRYKQKDHLIKGERFCLVMINLSTFIHYIVAWGGGWGGHSRSVRFGKEIILLHIPGIE